VRSGGRSTGRARRASSVRQRLALVVLLPTLGLAGFGGFEALGRSREAERTREVEVRVERATALLRVKLLVTGENFSTGATASAVALGVDPEALTSTIGFDPEQRVLQDRRAVDRAVEALGDDPEVSGPHHRLVLARRALDDAAPDVSDLLRRYSHVQADLTDSALTALDRAEEAAGRVASSSRLRTDTQLLRAAVEAATAVGVQLDGLGRLITPSPGLDRQAALDELRLGAAMDQLAAGDLDRLSTGRFHDQWWAGRTATDSVNVRAQFARFAAMAPAEVPTLDLQSMITIFVGGMHALDLHDDLAATAAHRTVVDAEALHDQADEARQVALGAVVAVVAAGLVLAGLISRSIARPLHALERRAQRVTGGELDDDPLPPAGPRELRAVSTTVDELVDNLRVVEWQVGALAAGNLDDPVLEVPVPGRLGRFLHDSVLRLSRSMSEREVLSRRLEHDATHDALTGLLNRGSLVAAARQAIDAGLPVALVKVDLDGFKPVNETHGHDTGDRLLGVTAERLRADAPGWDVARIGGDEFAVLLTGDVGPERVVQLAAGWIGHIGAPVRVGAVVTQVRASAGVAIAEPGLDAEDLLRHAGLAVTSAKSTGGGGVGRFDGAMLAEVERRADVETRLRGALDRDELCLHVQPVVDGELRSHGVEALLRWPQPDGTMVPPCAFIPVAEASDLVIDVGRWVLREACRILAEWTDDPFLGNLRLAVNLSGRHVLSLTVVDDVRRALDAAGVDPGRLSVEVTETVVLSDLALATEHLSRLRALGVAIVIDDFGTGYTSLAHLRQLPVDVIKVDRSLVVDAAERASDARVVELVVGAAKANGMAVVAEGIETMGQLDAMRAAGCDHFQGFLIARPGPVDALVSPVS
jgi:diguanylate cyclase (GGDEF)-like protein